MSKSLALVPFAERPKPAASRATSSLPRSGTGFPHLTNAQLVTDPAVADLLRMLSYMRPAASLYEEDYIEKYIDCLPKVRKDGYGNRWVVVGASPNIMWSSHTDTVHNEPGMQQVTLSDGFAYVADSSCLGADDTCGNWLMIQMIHAHVPGLYIFHREEEVGGHGSIYVARHYADEIAKAGIQACVAFDRKGYDSVITHQMGGRCCSDAFANSLAAILGGVFAIDTGGTFTDSANYTDIIGECTNLSVGYHGAHGPLEATNVAFLVGMRDVLLTADWSQLVMARKPGEADPDEQDWGRSFSGYGYGGTRSQHRPYDGPGARDYDERDIVEMIDAVKVDPDMVARFLLEMGYTADDVDDFAASYYDDPVESLGAADDDRWQ